MTTPALLAIISGVVTIIATTITVLNARKADKSASFTKTMEISVESLVDQLQEERDNYRKAAIEAEGKARELDAAVRSLENKVNELKHALDEKEHLFEIMSAELIRVKREAGLL